ncbi:MAG TPA: hypothetical protein VLX31_17860 [Streptosporangiaceae bacterium]|nr:hypothetical protein [Streptosporangiaceae bacterium]
MRATRQSASFPQADSEQPGAQATTSDVTRPASPRIDWEALKTARQACCCPARPAVIAIMPPGPGREHRTELLLCMHHFRLSRATLVAAGAVVVDLDRRIIPPDMPAYLDCSREPAH